MAEINLKYSRRLCALVLKPGKRDVVSYQLANRLSNSDFPELLRLRWEDADAEVFYYGVEGLSELNDFIRRPMSLVQYRTMLESLYAVMDLCVREGLPQGNVCFDASCVYVDERGAMQFAFVPFERVDGVGSALDLLLYLSGRKVRMVLPQDESARQAVADFAWCRSVLPAADLGSFLAERFGLGTCVGAVPARGFTGGSGSLGYTGSTGFTGATGVAKKPMTFDPVAMMAAWRCKEMSRAAWLLRWPAPWNRVRSQTFQRPRCWAGEARRARTGLPRTWSASPARGGPWCSCARATGQRMRCRMRP